MTPNNSPDSSHGDDPVKLPDDLRALEADLRLLEPRAFQPPSAIRPTPQLPAGPLAFANLSSATFVIGVLLGCVMGAALMNFFHSGDHPSDSVVAVPNFKPESVERSIADRETPISDVQREETQAASLSLIGIAQFFSQSAENRGRRVLLPASNQSLSASPHSWESLYLDELPRRQFRFVKTAASPQRTVLDLQKELLNSF